MEERAGDKKIFQQNNFPIYCLEFLFSMFSLGRKVLLEEQIKEQSTNGFMPTDLVIHTFSCKNDKGQYSVPNSRDNIASECMHILFSLCEVLSRNIFSEAPGKPKCYNT